MSAISTVELRIPDIFASASVLVFEIDEIQRASRGCQVPSGYVQVDQGGLYRLMAEQHLDFAQIAAHLEQMCGKAMAIMCSCT